MECKDIIDIVIKVAQGGATIYFAWMGLQVAQRAVANYQVGQTDRLLAKEEKALVAMRRFIAGVQYITFPVANSPRDKNDDYSIALEKERHARVVEAKEDVDTFWNVFLEAQMYLSPEMIKNAERLQEIWIDIRGNFRVHLFNLTQLDARIPNRQDIYERAFGMNVKDELVAIDNAIKARMAGINIRIRGQIEERERS